MVGIMFAFHNLRAYDTHLFIFLVFRNVLYNFVVKTMFPLNTTLFLNGFY